MTENEFAELVKLKRKSLGMSMKEFAEHIDCCLATVYRWENKRHMPKPDALDYWISKVNKAK